MGQSGEIAIDCSGAAARLGKTAGSSSAAVSSFCCVSNAAIFVSSSCTRFSFSRRAFAIALRSSASKRFCCFCFLEPEPFCFLTFASAKPLTSGSCPAPRSRRFARTWLLICRDSNRNRRDKMSAGLPFQPALAVTCKTLVAMARIK